jgi:hypothetical protein
VFASVTEEGVSEENANNRRAKPTVQPLGGHVGPAASNFHPLGVGREYRVHQASRDAQCNWLLGALLSNWTLCMCQ